MGENMKRVTPGPTDRLTLYDRLTNLSTCCFVEYLGRSGGEEGEEGKPPTGELRSRSRLEPCGMDYGFQVQESLPNFNNP